MNERDKLILKSLKDFKVLDRDQLVELHFSDLSDKKVACSRVMKRLERDGYVEPDKRYRPYWYYLKESKFKKGSAKSGHFREIANFIIQARKLGNLKSYEIEVKLGEKGTVEPDVFMLWNNAPLFVEVQNSLYSNKTMQTKIDRYEEYYNSGNWKNLHWQNPSKPFFPYIWIITDTQYKIKANKIKVFQTENVQEFIDKYMKKN